MIITEGKAELKVPVKHKSAGKTPAALIKASLTNLSDSKLTDFSSLKLIFYRFGFLSLYYIEQLVCSINGKSGLVFIPTSHLCEQFSHEYITASKTILIVYLN